MTATTALTAQNTTGVEEVFITPAAFVAKQINACLNDIKADAVKLGKQSNFDLFRCFHSDIAYCEACSPRLRQSILLPIP